MHSNFVVANVDYLYRKKEAVDTDQSMYSTNAVVTIKSIYCHQSVTIMQGFC